MKIGENKRKNLAPRRLLTIINTIPAIPNPIIIPLHKLIFYPEMKLIILTAHPNLLCLPSSSLISN